MGECLKEVYMIRKLNCTIVSICLMFCMLLTSVVNTKAVSFSTSWENQTITATVGQIINIPLDMGDASSVNFYTSNSAVCMVDNKYGYLLPIGAGSCTVECKGTGADGSTVSKYFTVNVNDNVNVKVGCDISAWQGTISVNKLKSIGMDFVIFRAGHGHTLASTTNEQGIDKNFYTYISQAKSAQMQYGVYWYLDCRTVEEAYLEADILHSALSNAGCYGDALFAFPIYLDIEANNDCDLTSIASAFVARLNGYGVSTDKIGIYANKTYYEKYINNSWFYQFSGRLWYARYNWASLSGGVGNNPSFTWGYANDASNPTFTVYAKMWQVGSSCQVPYRDTDTETTGRSLDMNYYYLDENGCVGQPQSSSEHHFVLSNTVAPTCTSNGYKVYRCDRCGLEYSANVTAAIGHNFVTTTSAKITRAKVSTCTRCGVTSTGSTTTSKTIYKGNTYNEGVKGTWKSSNKKVATVTSKGKITAKKAGTCTITGKVNGTTYKCKITVKNKTLKVSKTSVTLKSNKTVTVTAKATPSATVKWSSSNKKIATVSNGKIKAKRKGSCTITAKANGITKKIKVKVK